MVEPLTAQQKLAQGFLNRPSINVAGLVPASSDDSEVESIPSVKIVLFDSKGNPIEAEEPTPSSVKSPHSEQSLQSEQRVSKKHPDVPSLSLPGSSDSSKVTKKIPPHLLMTENEKRLQKQATMKVTGPYDKQWESFGVSSADDSEQIINTNKRLSQKARDKIKETVDEQMQDVIKEKRGWAYYEKFQPDYAAFQAEVKQVIMTLIGPTVTENTKNGMRIDVVTNEQDKLAKRIQEVEFVYKRVVKNASAQQDALSDLETRSKALRITEERLREQVKQCEGIKTQLSDKFKMLRDDRSMIMERLDHTDHELEQYRKDMRQLHDEISDSVFQRVTKIDERCSTNENQIVLAKQKLTSIQDQFDQSIKEDIREQAISIGKLQEHFIHARKQISDLDKALVNEFDWNSKNKVYDHQISLQTAHFNEIEFQFKNIKKYLGTDHKQDMQNQIDSTLQAVFGDRKKHMKMLKKFQKQFDQGLGDGGEGDFKKPRKAVIRTNIDVNSEESDSDNSMDRMAKQLGKLQEDGKVNLGGGGPGSVAQADVVNLLKVHEESKMEKVREKFIKKMPLRKQSRYVENGVAQFIQKQQTKLRVLHSKQIQSVNQLSVYKHMVINHDRRLSGSISSSSRNKTQSHHSSKLSVNFNRKSKRITADLGSYQLPNLKLNTNQPQNGKTKLAAHEADHVQFDKIELKAIFSKLKNKQQQEIAVAVLEELELQNSKHDVQLLKVKSNTIRNAVDQHKENPRCRLSVLQIAALMQVLSLKEVVDINGNAIKSDYVSKKLAIVEKMCEMEAKKGDSSSDESSQDSRRGGATGLMPPVIETQLATDRSRRSKTMLPDSRNRMVERTGESGSSSSLEESPGLVNKHISDLRSVNDTSLQSSESSSDSKSTVSLSRSASKKTKLALKKASQAKKSQVSINLSDSSVDQKNRTQEVNLPRNRTEIIKTKGVGTVLSSYGDESFDYDANTSQMQNTQEIGSELQIEESQALPPPFADVPSTDEILVKMKDQIDDVENTVKERTTEIREIQKYIKRMEQALITQLQTELSSLHKQIEYNHCDCKALIQTRMDLVSKKLVKNNSVVSGNKDQFSQDLIAMRKRIKVTGRKTDSRLDQVNNDHDKLTGKYDFLIHQNDYFSKLAEQMIVITELNSSLMTADEQDKHSICLMGTTGPKTLHEKQNEQQLHRIQQQIDDLDKDKSDGYTVSGTAAGQTPGLRPKSGMSRVSQKSMKTNLTKTSKMMQFDATEDQPIIQMDKKCVSCSDNKGQLIQLFKLACLSYFPGKVDYNGQRYAKPYLITRQQEYVSDLRQILAASAEDPSAVQNTTARLQEKAYPVREKIRIDEDSSSCNEAETMLNSEQKAPDGLSKHYPISSGQTSPRALAQQHGSEEPVSQNPNLGQSIDNRRQSNPSNMVGALQSNLRNPSQKQIRPLLSPQLPQPFHANNISPSQACETEPNSNMTPMQAKEDQVIYYRAGTDEATQQVDGPRDRLTTETTTMHNKRVSFDQGQQPQQYSQVASQQLTSQNQPQQTEKSLPIPIHQTSFRFNATHELLAFNQEQVAKIVPNPVSELKYTGKVIDGKLLQIQKLKEKALMIQMSREVNKPNNFIQQPSRNSSKTPKAAFSSGLDAFSQAEHVQNARDMARIKHSNETKIMIDTRERFTKRFQFDKLSHKLLSHTPTDTQMSGSEHNMLASYDSKTIFRKVHQEPAAAQDSSSGQPKTYANLIGNKSPSLPNLKHTRGFSAQRSFVNLQSEEILSDQFVLSKRKAQRPTSTMLDQSRNKNNCGIWRTQQRPDGRTMVIMNQQSQQNTMMRFNQQRESNGTEQLNAMMRANSNQSSVNFSQQ